MVQFDGEVVAGFADLEQQPIIGNECRPDDYCIRTTHPHLPNVEIRTVGDVKSFHRKNPFRKALFSPLEAYPSTTTRPPKRSNGEA